VILGTDSFIQKRINVKPVTKVDTRWTHTKRHFEGKQQENTFKQQQQQQLSPTLDHQKPLGYET